MAAPAQPGGAFLLAAARVGAATAATASSSGQWHAGMTMHSAMPPRPAMQLPLSQPLLALVQVQHEPNACGCCTLSVLHADCWVAGQCLWPGRCGRSRPQQATNLKHRFWRRPSDRCGTRCYRRVLDQFAYVSGSVRGSLTQQGQQHPAGVTAVAGTMPTVRRATAARPGTGSAAAAFVWNQQPHLSKRCNLYNCGISSLLCRRSTLHPLAASRSRRSNPVTPDSA